MRTVQDCDLSRYHLDKMLKEVILRPDYPCIAAKRAISGGEYLTGIYGTLPSTADTPRLVADLKEYIAHQQASNSVYLSFIAAFANPLASDELTFEAALWNQLQLLHESSKKHFAWDKLVSSDPTAWNFGFSFGGHAFFVVGMHPKSSRKSRVFPYPILVFNLYSQFEALKSLGQLENMKAINRKLDFKFQGSINPMLTRFGEDSEAVQYSGRDVGNAWTCPFKM